LIVDLYLTSIKAQDRDPIPKKKFVPQAGALGGAALMQEALNFR